MNTKDDYDFYEYSYWKQTKILATCGPACSDEKTLESMFNAGLDCVRINFGQVAKADQYIHLVKVIALIRKLSRKLKRSIAIVVDLQGPRIRVGYMEGGSITLEKGASILLTPHECLGTSTKIEISYKELAKDLHVGDILLLDDGAIRIKVTRLLPNNDIEAIIVRGGKLSSRRGINVPGVQLSLPALTEKDLKDIEFIVAHNIEYISLSFTQTADDISNLKAILQKLNSHAHVIAKIETKSALDNIESIVQVSDAVMVARGDLAIETSFANLPFAQERIIQVCQQYRKPVIVATQMLESMTKSPNPTRAEVMDVANAVLSGVDVVMLSGETAIGDYPIEVVRTMANICHTTERFLHAGDMKSRYEVCSPLSIEEFIANKITEKARFVKAAVIVTYAERNSVAHYISHFRSPSPIVLLTRNKHNYRRMSLVRGVYPILVEGVRNQHRVLYSALSYLHTIGVTNAQDYVVIASTNGSGELSNIELHQVPAEGYRKPLQQGKLLSKKQSVDEPHAYPIHGQSGIFKKALPIPL